MTTTKQLSQYLALAEREKNADYAGVARELAELKRRSLSPGENVEAGRLSFSIKLARALFGFTFAVKLIEGRTIDKEVQAVYEKIDEESVEFTGSIILGLNDGLIELTGVLVGFSSVFQNLQIVALSGLITGISAALSMASSAYMQARHENGKHPTKAAAYTGIAYFIVVIILVAPFLLLSTTANALAAMFAAIFVILALVSWYTGVLFDRKFVSQFGELVLFSMGVALVAYLIGNLFRNITGIEI